MYQSCNIFCFDFMMSSSGCRNGKYSHLRFLYSHTYCCLALVGSVVQKYEQHSIHTIGNLKVQLTLTTND